MVAAVKIYELTASRAGVDKTASLMRFKSANSTTIDTANRLEIPAAGKNYSFSKYARMYVATGPSVDLQNLKAYTDGTKSWRTGINMQYKTMATMFTANSSLDINGTPLFTASAGFPILLGQGLASTAFLATGFKGKLLKLQMTASAGADPGLLATQEVLTLAYDET